MLWIFATPSSTLPLTQGTRMWKLRLWQPTLCRHSCFGPFTQAISSMRNTFSPALVNCFSSFVSIQVSHLQRSHLWSPHLPHLNMIHSSLGYPILFCHRVYDFFFIIYISAYNYIFFSMIIWCLSPPLVCRVCEGILDPYTLSLIISANIYSSSTIGQYCRSLVNIDWMSEWVAVFSHATLTL